MQLGPACARSPQSPVRPPSPHGGGRSRWAHAPFLPLLLGRSLSLFSSLLMGCKERTDDVTENLNFFKNTGFLSMKADRKK